jgi:hypothetical protein
MLSETHIYRAAQVLIDQYHDRAWSEAVTRMERYWRADNDDEMNLWRLIANAIYTMQSSGIPDGSITRH